MKKRARDFSTSDYSVKIAALLVSAVIVWAEMKLMRGTAMEFPGAVILSGLSQTLSYMEIFFHELGHTVFSWSFASPAIPSFDFANGGGMTYTLDRIWALQYVIWALWCGAIIGCLKHKENMPALILTAFLALHVAAGLSTYYKAVVAAAGHVTTILLAVFCLWRVSEGLVDKMAEKVMNVIFGYFVLGHGVTLFGGLYFSPHLRRLYKQQKGGEILGDVDVLAATTSFSMTTISFWGMLLSGGLMLFFLWSHFMVKSR